MRQNICNNLKFKRTECLELLFVFSFDSTMSFEIQRNQSNLNVFNINCQHEKNDTKVIFSNWINYEEEFEYVFPSSIYGLLLPLNNNP
jgi:hypothetical protein